ncbi:MAG TPA: hypothetical protein PKD54_02610 [Pirellulaceae bacterium]|nr:hypothetical protein [Pirellulaceae bacterium]
MLKKSLSTLTAQPDHFRAKWLFWTLLAMFGSFFIATILVYIILRTQVFLPIRQVYEPLVLPFVFWPSSALLIATSLFLERAIWLIRRERVAQFQRWLWFAAIAAFGFCVLHPLGIHDLITQHQGSLRSHKFYGFSSVLIIVHALHVLGGMAYLGFVIVQSYRGKYDHERHWAVNHCAGYWHFLDIVWLVMVATFVYIR